MRKVLLIVAMALAFTAAGNAGKLEFQTGKLINIADDERLYEGTSFQVGALHCVGRGHYLY